VVKILAIVRRGRKASRGEVFLCLIQKGETFMALLAKFAWPIQIAIFILLFFALPHTSSRIFIMLGYIVLSTMLVRYIKRT